MNYMYKVDMRLDDLLLTVVQTPESDTRTIASIKNEIKEIVLESFKNGQASRDKSGGGSFRRFVGAFTGEAVRQASYTSPKRPQYRGYKKYSKPRK